MAVRIRGRRMYLWRAVDDEDEVLDVLVQKCRNKHAALTLLRKLLRSQGGHPETITTDRLASYRAAARELGLTDRHRPGGMRENNRAAVYNTFNLQLHLVRRSTLRQFRAEADRAWAAATAAA